MKICYLDPIFLAIKDSITFKHYKYSIFPILNNFVDEIETIEEETGERVVLFNICRNLIYTSMQFNPFQFDINKSSKRFFERFLLQFLYKHYNPSCEDKDLRTKSNNIKYENNFVPEVIMGFWNTYLNQCFMCIKCQKDKLDLLSYEKMRSQASSGSKKFFIDIYYDLIDWLKDIQYVSSIPPLINIDPKLKKKGNWKHSHSRTVLRKIDKLLNCKYVKEIRPIGTTRKVNQNDIKMVDHNELKVYLSSGDGAEIFKFITTARSNNENYYIEGKIKENL